MAHPPTHMQEEPLILICDHRGAGLSSRLSRLASTGHRLCHTSHLRETVQILRKETPDLIILEPFAPSGRAELDEIDRLRGDDNLIPLLFVSDPDRGLPAPLLQRDLRDEAWDVIHRDATIDEFEMRIERLFETAARFDELEELRYVASHDDRTDLLRPEAFEERLREHFSATQRHRLDLVFIILDLDDFGQINKVFDHTVGDLVIERVGEAIRRALRAEDVAGRLGGDEFAVLLPYTKRLAGARVVSRIRAEVEELTHEFAARGVHARISCSLGFETFSGIDIETVKELRRHTEVAMQRAKRAGGNCGVYFRSQPDINS